MGQGRIICRMQREEERKRRRVRDRERRQSMTQEQRERHLARRRRNYQLRRQRRQRAANANANAPFGALLQPNPHFPHSSTGDDSSSAELQRVTPAHHTVLILNHGHIQAQDTSQIVEEPSIQLRGLQGKLRLSSIKQLARNPRRSNPSGNHKLAADLLLKADASGGDGCSCTTKPWRLSRVKRLARSISTPSKETAPQKNLNGTVKGTNC